MKQEINFYTEILRIRNIPISFDVMKNFIYGLFLFMIVSTIILGIIQIKNERDLKELEKQQLNTFSQLQTQESKITSKSDREQIITQLEITNKLYEKNKRVLEELEYIMQSGSKGFSPYLLSLSNSVPKGVWLTAIEVSDSGKRFSLTGKTVEAKLVTNFISELKKESPFSGKALNILNLMYNKTDGTLDFKIQTGTEVTENPS